MKELIFKNIKTFNEVLKPNEVYWLHNLILSTPMYWSGTDVAGGPVNTLTKQIVKGDKLFDHLQEKIFQVEPRLKEHALQKAGINLMMPQTNPPYFHNDGGVITCLFYLTQKVSLNDGGETQFEFDDYIVGSKPTPGKLVIFDGMIEHRATYFRQDTRIVVFFKYFKNSSYNLFD